jgi:chromosomal replication initiation ATPase DnaA
MSGVHSVNSICATAVLRGQAVMGSEEIVEEVMNKHGGEKGKKTEVARREELVTVKPEAIMAAVGKYYGIIPEQMKGRGWRHTEPRYVASYLMRRYGFMGLREIGEQVGLHFSAVGNAVQRVADNPTRAMAQSLKDLKRKFKNQKVLTLSLPLHTDRPRSPFTGVTSGSCQFGPTRFRAP